MSISNASLMRAADPAGDGRFQGEWRIVHEDGTEQWALAFGRMHFAGEGNALSAAQLIGTVLDITEQKHAEARQRVLARVGTDLLAAAEEHVTLRRLAEAAVADLADWAIVDVIEPDRRTARRAAMAHADPAKVSVMRECHAVSAGPVAAHAWTRRVGDWASPAVLRGQ